MQLENAVLQIIMKTVRAVNYIKSHVTCSVRNQFEFRTLSISLQASTTISLITTRRVTVLIILKKGFVLHQRPAHSMRFALILNAMTNTMATIVTYFECTNFHCVQQINSFFPKKRKKEKTCRTRYQTINCWQS